MTADAREVTPEELRGGARSCHSERYRVMLDAAAARIEELTDENRVQLAAIADLQVGCANDHAVIVGLRAERDAALAQLAEVRDVHRAIDDARVEAIERLDVQLALARPIAEACVRWIETGGLCACCNAGPYDGHASDCPVPAWIAGRK